MKNLNISDFIEKFLNNKINLNVEEKQIMSYVLSDVVKSNFEYFINNNESEALNEFTKTIYDIENANTELNLKDCKSDDYRIFVQGFLSAILAMYNLKRYDDIQNKEIKKIFKNSKYNKKILLYIHNNSGINQTELSKKLNITSSYLSKLLYKIKEENLIYSLNNGSSNQLYLTSLGLEYIKKNNY